MIRLARVAAIALACSIAATPALARHHKHHHHHRHNARAFDASGNAAFAKVNTALGLTATVIASAHEQFQGFIDTVERDYREPETGTLERGNRIADIGCLSRGHMRNSKHHWGGACDFAQLRRNVTAAFMYHVTAIAEKFGLVDGCTWRGRGRYQGPDCGHIEVAGSNTARHNPSYRLAMK